MLNIVYIDDKIIADCIKIQQYRLVLSKLKDTIGWKYSKTIEISQKTKLKYDKYCASNICIVIIKGKYKNIRLYGFIK
jgi:hypothetical protein